jgi:hypothetical protein
MRTIVGVLVFLLPLWTPRPALAQLWDWPSAGHAPAGFSSQLAELDPVPVESLATAHAALVKGLDAWGPEDAEHAFRAFWAFYRRVVRSHDPSIDRPEVVGFLSRLCDGRPCGYYMVRALEASTDPAVLQALAENQRLLAPARTLRRAGIEVVYGEGKLYRAEDGAFPASLARRLPVGPFREFVEFYASESTIFVSDAAIVIPWLELGQRLARWETFARTHPNLPETKAVVAPETGRLREFFVCGVSNTPAYEPPGGALRRIEPRVLEAYEQFVAANSASATTALLRNVLEHLARTRGVLDDPLREYMRTAMGSARTNCERR